MATTLYEVQVSDVEYQPGLLATVYRPRASGSFPAVLDVHGGAWHLGTRANNTSLDRDLAASGLVVAAIDFRMPPKAGYPASIADANLGVRWLKAHAAVYGGRPDTVGVLGTSSGGHIATLSSLRPRDARYAALPGPPDVDASVRYIVACWAILDPTARYAMAKRVGRNELVEAHDAYWVTEAAMAEGNPTLLLERGEPAELPPMLILQGTSDDNVTLDMQRRFVAAYQARGGQAQLHVYEGMPHAWIVREPERPESARAIDAILTFIRGIDQQ